MNKGVNHPRPLDGRATPLDVIARWPNDLPISMLHVGRTHDRWARWSILGIASEQILLRHPNPLDTVRTHLPNPLSDHAAGSRDGLLFTGGWIVQLDYELGRVIEPRVRAGCADRRDPDSFGVLTRCDDALLFDHLNGQWHAVGSPGHAIERLVEAAGEPASHAPDAFTVSSITAAQPAGDIRDAIREVIEKIAAGDIFQANLTQRFTATFQGSVRALFREAVRVAQPWYAALLEQPDGRTVLSMSPELFLEYRPDEGSIRTRPIKGTRPSHDDPETLRRSEKDAAELNMIIDLMRNDLGRICEPGTVEVEQLRTIESHPTVHHGVATVAGRLATGTTFEDILRATFPPGSVTGAPKIRAMQIIEELEPLPRGAYCGTIGFISDSGHVGLNVAIRTIEIVGDQLVYGAGGGIVADSEPQAEYDEAIDKTEVLRQLVRPPRPEDKS